MREFQHPQKHGTRCARFRCISTLLTLCLLTILNTPIVYAGGDTQTINLNVQNASLEKVFSEIEKQTHYSFLYMQSLIQKAKNVTVKINNATLEKVLEICFKDQPQLTYSIMDKVVVVKPKEKKGSEVEAGGVEQDPIDVTGKVVDENGKPVAGVTVTVKGTKKQTITNENGEFKFSNVDIDAVLMFSSVNMEAFQISVGGQTEIVAKLKAKTSQLDEVQIIAYGQTTKRLQTGNVGTVKLKDIEKQPVTNPLLTLQGRVPGLFITQSSGLPGSGITVRIQGQNSLRMGNDPLYVIDGVPFMSQLLPNIGYVLGSSGSSQSGSPLSYLNPLDIESIDVLKDADATAIYGSRAANGAILITTKKGKVGQSRIELQVRSGWGTVAKKLNVLNISEYLQMRREALKNDGITIPTTDDYDLNGFWDTTHITDWQKELIGKKARYEDYQASISGGNSNTQFLFGTSYHRETTVFPGDFADKKQSVHFSLINTSSNQKLRFQLTGSYQIDDNRLSNTDFTVEAVRLAPNAPAVYKTDGTLNWMENAAGFNSWDNPLRRLYETYRNKANNLISNAILTYTPLRRLTLSCNLGYTNLQTKEIQVSPMVSYAPWLRQYVQRNGSYGNNSVSSWIIEPQVSYSRNIGRGKIEALLGTTIQENNSHGVQLLGLGYNSDKVIEDIKSAANVEVNSSLDIDYKYFAVFGRLNYNYNDKYLMNFTVRRDGSSRFGMNNQFHNFGSISGAWLFSKERFVQNAMKFLSFGKLKVSYGTTGNDLIGDYQFLNLYSTINTGVPYQGVTGLGPTGLPNPDLQWEETKKASVGVELGFMNDRIFITSSYFRNRSSNQLLAYPLPTISGFTSIAGNLPATVQNMGWEFTLSSTNIKSKEFNWATNFNITIPKNKLVDFPNLINSGYANSFFIGEPITLQLNYKYLGVNSNNGVYEFSDGRGGVTTMPDTSTVARIAHINTSPRFYGGIDNSFRFKGFQLDVFFQFVKQIAPNYSLGYIPGALNGGLSNQPKYVLDRWQKLGDQAMVQKYNSDYALLGQFNNAISSDIIYQDATFIRLKNISLSWQIPDQWRHKVRLQNARIYIQGQNLVTFTKYKGLDPETKSSVTLPPLRILTAGISLTF